MNQDRAKLAEAALKNVETLKKEVSINPKTVKPVTQTGPTKIQPSGLPEPIAGMGFVSYILYFIGAVLVLGIILMVVDYWFFPIFKRKPGGAGYVSLPGSDTSERFWTELSSSNTAQAIKNITIGAPPPDVQAATPPPVFSVSVEGQSTYSMTLDILINDEKPQTLPPNTSRTLFILGTSVTSPKITITMDNTKNTAHITIFSVDPANPSNRFRLSTVIDNIPIHTPFRIGLVKTSHALEAYLNGLLIQTRKLTGQDLDPVGGDIIFAPQNITITQGSTQYVLSKGIQVMNLRLFPYAVQPNEMIARMSDLTQSTTFNPLNSPPSLINSISTLWQSL
jgi:hypothetical protein